MDRYWVYVNILDKKAERLYCFLSPFLFATASDSPSEWMIKPLSQNDSQ